MKVSFLYCLLILCSSPSWASETFSCEPAKVTVAINSSDRQIDGVEVVLTVSHKKKSTLLRFDSNVDFFGAECRKNKRGMNLVVFQAVCGGSSCHDLDNYGIINPDDLRVLLVPNDSNRKEASQIMGSEIQPIQPSNTYSLERRKKVNDPTY